MTMPLLRRTRPCVPTAWSLHARLLCWLAIGLACTALLAGCANTHPPQGMQPVQGFDFARYQGRWYELARLDHAFERGMDNVSARYTPSRTAASRWSTVAASLPPACGVRPRAKPCSQGPPARLR
jgi:apolipoprotein D and lipocalin family protein